MCRLPHSRFLFPSVVLTGHRGENFLMSTTFLYMLPMGDKRKSSLLRIFQNQETVKSWPDHWIIVLFTINGDIRKLTLTWAWELQYPCFTSGVNLWTIKPFLRNSNPYFISGEKQCPEKRNKSRFLQNNSQKWYCFLLYLPVTDRFIITPTYDNTLPMPVQPASIDKSLFF